MSCPEHYYYKYLLCVLLVIKVTAAENAEVGSPFGNDLWMDLQRYQTIAVKYYSCMSDALHIRPKDACNF